MPRPTVPRLVTSDDCSNGVRDQVGVVLHHVQDICLDMASVSDQYNLSLFRFAWWISLKCGKLRNKASSFIVK